MWGTSSNFPGISSYEQAKKTFEEIKPLRGKPNFRPLDRRSSQAKSQILFDDVTDDYIICLYRTHIVRYTKDGDVILNTGGHNTTTTVTAMSAIRLSASKAAVKMSNLSFSRGVKSISPPISATILVISFSARIKPAFMHHFATITIKRHDECCILVRFFTFLCKVPTYS